MLMSVDQEELTVMSQVQNCLLYDHYTAKSLIAGP